MFACYESLLLLLLLFCSDNQLGPEAGKEFGTALSKLLVLRVIALGYVLYHDS